MNQLLIAVIALSSFLIGCSGGGGGSSPSSPAQPESYLATYEYPANDLLPGQGSREVSAAAVLSCKNSKGEDVEITLCPPAEEAPKQVQKSPAGSVEVIVDGAEGGKVVINLPEGDEFHNKPQSEKETIISSSLTCESGRVKVSAECRIPGFEAVYTAYSSPTKIQACDGTEVLNRSYLSCRNNITLETVEDSLCSGHVDPQPTKEHKSPAGEKVVSVAAGTQTFQCLEGQDIASATLVDVTCSLVGQHKSGLACVPDTYTATFKGPGNTKEQVCSGTETVTKVIDQCLRDHDGAAMALNLCDGQTTTETVTYNSPAGARSFTPASGNYSGSPVESCSEGSTTWNVVAESFSCLATNHKTPDGRDCAPDTISCLIPELPEHAVAGDRIWSGSDYGSCLASQCLPGYYPASGACLAAPVGSYADGTANIQCPANSSTAGTGSSSVEDCLASSGYYKEAGLFVPVGIGHYSEDLNNDRVACPLPDGATSVERVGATTSGSVQDCHADVSAITGCVAGKYLQSPVSKVCEAVPVGYYSEGGAVSATQCPANMTTAWTLSTSRNDCIASAGYKMVDGEAVACNNGEYQDLIGQNSCKTCSTPDITALVSHVFTNVLATTSNSCEYLVTRCANLYIPSVDGQDCDSGAEVANINNPSSAVLLGKSGENVFFTARDPAENVELFVTKWGPSTVELVKGGLTPGAGISTIKNLTSMGDGRALFSVSSSTYGYELWITDGTSAGTVLVKDTNPGPASGSPGKIVSIGNGKFIFTASRPDTGSEAWVTDGTENGTQLIVDLVPGGGSSGPVASLNEGHGIILANVPGVGSGVFITDGTAQGTSLAVNIGCSSFGAALGTEDGRAVFNCTLPATGSELWVTDGTSAGTFMLKDIAPGTASGNVSSIHLLAPGKILFTANNGTHGIEPYYSDLTQAGTVMLMDGVAGSGGSAPDTKGAMVGNDGKFIFAFTYGSNGKEPVVSDGTPGGTKLLVDLAPGNGSSAPSQFTRLSDGRVMFTAGTVAWVTSGQQGDPQLLLPAPFDIVKSHTGFMVYDGTKVLMVGDDKYGTAGDGDLFYIDIDSIDGIRGN